MPAFTAKPHSPALAALVKSFHYHETDLPFALERIMPNGQAHLMVNLGENEFRTYDPACAARLQCHTAAVLSGPRAQPAILDTREQRLLVAVEFRLGAAGQFFSVPMSEVANRTVSLEDLWARDGALLRERLLDAPTPALKFHLLEEALLRHLRPDAHRGPDSGSVLGFDPAIRYAISALEAGLSVLQVADRLGQSSRTFTRRFSAQVGITPRRFARVRRLQRVLRAARRTAIPDWSALAVQHGFTDQPHLVHDFRDLAGITPSAYKPHSPRRNNHVPIAAG